MSKEKEDKSTKPTESVQDTIVEVAKEQTTDNKAPEPIEEKDTTQDTIVDPAKEETTTDKLIVEPTRTSNKREKIASLVFDKNSDLETIYFTSDLIPFKSETDALRHANSLNNKSVTTVNKSNLQ